MMELLWHKATLKEVELIHKTAIMNRLLENNYGAVNTFLYKEKFKSEIAVSDDWLFERCFDGNKVIYSFPHNINGDISKIDKALNSLKLDAETLNCLPEFKNINLFEKNILCQNFTDFICTETRQYSDYIYLAENLSQLSGNKFSKKRNHVSRFCKKFPSFDFKMIDNSLIKDALFVEEKWVEENTKDIEGPALEDLKIEKAIIELAFDNFDYLSEHCGLKGGILYIENEPVAFCLSSLLSLEVTDIHFEKCINSVAASGGYAVINQLYAKSIETKFINREEDLGIEGLRKAKLSYYPEMILEKFNFKLTK